MNFVVGVFIGWCIYRLVIGEPIFPKRKRRRRHYDDDVYAWRERDEREREMYEYLKDRYDR